MYHLGIVLDGGQPNNAVYLDIQIVNASSATSGNAKEAALLDIIDG